MDFGRLQIGYAGKAALLFHLVAALALWQYVLATKVQQNPTPLPRVSAISTPIERAGEVASPQMHLRPHVRPARALTHKSGRFYVPGVAMAAAGLDAESRYFSAMALEECYALSHDGVTRFRDDFAQQLHSTIGSTNQNQKWSREQAFNRSLRDCIQFDGTPISPNYVLGLIQSAAHDGDPRAIARTLLFRDLAESKVGSFDVVARLLSSGDPHVIRDVGLFLTRGESTFTVGDSAVPVQATTLAVAWELVACDFGLDCGSESKLLSNLCAYQAQCGALSYEDWLDRHTESREELAEILRLRMLLRRGLMFHDWALLGLPALQPSAVAKG